MRYVTYLKKLIGIKPISSEFLDNIYKEITNKCKIINVTLSKKSINPKENSLVFCASIAHAGMVRD